MARLELILTRYHFNVFELVFLTRTPTVVTRTTPLKRDRRPPLSRSSKQEVAQRSKRERTRSRTSERRSLKTNGSVSRDAQTSTTYETCEPQHSVSFPRVLECINSPLRRRVERLGAAFSRFPSRASARALPIRPHARDHSPRASPPASDRHPRRDSPLARRPRATEPCRPQNAVQSPQPPSPRPSPLVSRRVSSRTRRTHRVKERRSRARARTMSGGVCGRDDGAATQLEAIVGRRDTS
jgi:hypothetical protein